MTWLPAAHSADGPTGSNPVLVLDLVQRVGNLAAGDTTDFRAVSAIDEAVIAAWCDRSGNELVGVTAGVATIRRGRRSDALARRPRDHQPGARVWMYTNFDCNLSCDYCCARSSPTAARRELGLTQVRRIAAESVDAGVDALVLTGGEPFLLNDIADLVHACSDRLPTTLLTNAMLFRGARLERLRRMDRDRVTLQISLDSPTPEVHDSHRGARSWQRAVDGIATAQAEGFRVRVAATLMPEHLHHLEPFHTFLDTLGIARDDQLIRALAHRGFSDQGLELTVETLIPEVTITADGVYWHPVGIDDDQLVTRELFPLADAIAEVRRRYGAMLDDTEAAARWFACA